MADSNETPRPQPQRPQNIPDDEQAAAIAEVNVLPDANLPPNNPGTVGGDRRNAANRANEVEEEFQAGEVQHLDEAGVKVRNAFLEFLYEFWEPVDKDENDQQDEEEELSQDGETGQNQQQQQQGKYYPYHEQANKMASLQLDTPEEDDETNTTNNTNNPNNNPSAGFSTTMFVDYDHLQTYSTDLATAISEDYVRFEPYVRTSLKSFLHHLHPELDDLTTGSMNTVEKNRYFLAVHNMPSVVEFRSLRTDAVGKLTCFSGTVTRTSDVRPELLLATFRCTECGILAENIAQQYHFTRPVLCRNPRCKNTRDFVLDVPLSTFVDWQKLRVQECSGDVPPGCMPRSMDVIVRNEMVERCKAGDSVVFVGSVVVVPDGSALARAGEAPQSARGGGGSEEAAQGGGGGVRGLKATGVRELTYRTCFVAMSIVSVDALARYRNQSVSDPAGATANFLFGSGGGKEFGEEEMKTTKEVAMEMTEEEKEDVMTMKNTPNLYSKMVESIAPTTFGHQEVKRGILLQLLGGVHKTTSEGMRLRGDVNVCIVGDPSVAKSQFLKYVHSFLPSRSVYTSGKASSAAGLTAAVQRDQDTGEYCIEAGALMLADNGICCIDEFDKMDPSDQVAIHEAMEQQTISITKAGIQATLNARASILAAANPIYGRYDRGKTLKANVALSAPILSRFDLFFVVLDECDELADYNVAKHILDVHRCDETASETPFTKEQMQKYVRFARTIHPKITPECQKVLVECYRKLRQGDTMGRSRTAYRITVRQLESMIRLSEALARLHLNQVILPSYVKEAFRLLRKSIIHVETEDVTFEEEDDDEEDGGGGSGVVEGEGNGRDVNEDVDKNNGPIHHRGEYTSTDQESNDLRKRSADMSEQQTTSSPTQQQQPPLKKKPKKSKGKKTQITFEEYEAISNACATYLRSLEDDRSSSSSYLTWGETVRWYVEQNEDRIGDSMEELKRLTKLTNLVIRRLIDVDHVLVYIGGQGATEGVKEQDRKIAVHPNYVLNG